MGHTINKKPTLVTLLGNFVPFIDLFSRNAEYLLCFCSEHPFLDNPWLYYPWNIWSISYDQYNNIWQIRSGIQILALVTWIYLPKMTRSRQTFIFANKNDQKIIIMMTIITAIDNAIIYWSGIFPPWFNFLCFSESEKFVITC